MQSKKTADLPDLTPEQQGALSMIYELYYGQMYKKAYGILKNKQDAEDAVQDAFYHVCCNAEVFLSPQSERTAALIHTYTRNMAINHYHKKKRLKGIMSDERCCDDVLSVDWYDLAKLIEKQEAADCVRRAVDALEEHYREVILLKYFEHQKNTEIAQRLELGQNVVNGRIHRAKKALRKKLEQELA